MSLAERSLAFWDTHQVASFTNDVSPQESLERLEWRNNLYPGLEELMPVTGFQDLDVLDFGCGPGHDTLGFLFNGARHVYAVDPSTTGRASLRARLRAHGFTRCTVSVELPLRPVDHIHAAGVIHHLADPAATLRRLGRRLKPDAEIRMMVYSAESQFYREFAGGSPERFLSMVDHGAPIANAWTRREVEQLASQAGLDVDYLGSYRVPSETEGPGLSSCWSLR